MTTQQIDDAEDSSPVCSCYNCHGTGHDTTPYLKGDIWTSICHVCQGAGWVPSAFVSPFIPIYPKLFTDYETITGITTNA